MTDTAVPAPSSQRPIDVADWAEAELLVSRRPYLTSPQLRRGLEDALFIERTQHPEDPEDRAEARVTDEDPDTIIENMLYEVDRRRSVAPRSYPFIPEFGQAPRLRRDSGVEGGPYDFCLCLSVSDRFRDERRIHEPSMWFEFLVVDALKSFLGSESEGVRFGTPVPDDEERPTTFPEALDWLADQMGLQRGVGRARRQRNDGGVDAVVWRRFPDGLPGHVILLGQATLARQWRGKETDVNTDLWRGFLDIRKYPDIAFALPFIVDPNDRDYWDELGRKVHVILDRLRLTELAVVEDIQRQDEIERWTEREIEALQEEG